MKSKFCPFCGERTILKEIGDEGAVPYCASCGCALFDSPRPCVIVLAVNEKDEAVLIRQSYVSEKYPVCVAGYIKPRDRAEETAARELLEETGLRAESLRYIGSYPHTAKELLMLGFAVRVKKAPFFLSKEVDAAAWYSPEDALTAVKPGGAGQSLVRDCVERDGAGNLHFLKV